MLIPSVLVLCSVIGCQDNAVLEQFKAQAALEKANRALGERYIDASSRADYGALKEVLSPDYVHHLELGRDESVDEALKGLKLRATMFPDQPITVEDLFVKGDKIAWRGVFRGSHTGDIEGFPATGKGGEMEAFAILRVEDGRIAEAWGSRDLLSLYQQL